MLPKMVYEQYDSMVGTINKYQSPKDAGVVNIKGSKSLGHYGRLQCSHGECQPRKGCAMAVAEAPVTFVQAGSLHYQLSEFLVIHTIQSIGFVGAIKGMSKACRKFETLYRRKRKFL